MNLWQLLPMYALLELVISYSVIFQPVIYALIISNLPNKGFNILVVNTKDIKIALNPSIDLNRILDMLVPCVALIPTIRNPYEQWLYIYIITENLHKIQIYIQILKFNWNGRWNVTKSRYLYQKLNRKLYYNASKYYCF